MKIKVARTDFTEKSTIGNMSIDGDFVCYTLEDKVREKRNKPVAQWKIRGETAIPRGTYNVVDTFSNRFRRDMLLLQNVPGFSGIRLHAGNWAKNTEGCILVGTGKTTDMITHSVRAVVKVEKLVRDAILRGEEVTMEIG